MLNSSASRPTFCFGVTCTLSPVRSDEGTEHRRKISFFVILLGILSVLCTEEIRYGETVNGLKSTRPFSFNSVVGQSTLMYIVFVERNTV